MIFVDTGYLLALVRPRDSLHARAQTWARTLGGPLLITEHVLWETVNGLSAPLDRPKAHTIIARLRSSPDCEIVAASETLFALGLELHAQRPDKEWSLTDCISLVVMQQRGIRHALTPDHHFEQAGFDAIMRRDPP
jgi:predicted nucleic acid-binding protein